ncbi:hypothetical protein ACQR3P_29005 [Rhodococcus sp. IEGM1300]
MLVAASVIFYAVGLGLIYMGADKYLNYVNDDPEEMGLYAADSVNAYVGGDAYNYIINGTYMTAYFALAGAFIVAATLFVVTHVLVKRRNVSNQDAAVEPAIENQGGN